jgi:dephospho-CoA kinase
MLVIGLTGGIGSGKTTIADLFKARGIPIIDADIIAREVTAPGQPALKTITQHFGQHILQEDGSLNRSALRDTIFKNDENRHWLENLLHPLILRRMDELLQQQNTPYCLVVIPLLFEKNTYPLINRILVVDTSEEMQINRVTKRDKTSREQVKAIMTTQASRGLRIKHANDIITNDGSLVMLEKQVEELHQKYLQLAGTPR